MLSKSNTTVFTSNLDLISASIMTEGLELPHRRRRILAMFFLAVLHAALLQLTRRNHSHARVSARPVASHSARQSGHELTGATGGAENGGRTKHLAKQPLNVDLDADISAPAAASVSASFSPTHNEQAHAALQSEGGPTAALHAVRVAGTEDVQDTADSGMGNADRALAGDGLPVAMLEESSRRLEVEDLSTNCASKQMISASKLSFARTVWIYSMNQSKLLFCLQGRSLAFSPPHLKAAAGLCGARGGNHRAEEAINTLFALPRRNFIPLFYGVSEIFLRPRKIPL
jgi:hypothetical protein